jgi:hypothetical protein
MISRLRCKRVDALETTLFESRLQSLSCSFHLFSVFAATFAFPFYLRSRSTKVPTDKLGRDSPIVKNCSSIKNPCFVTCVNSALFSNS